MYNEVKIGNINVPMLCMASADVYYRNVFHEDPIKIQAESSDNAGAMVTFYTKMGFILAKFAELKDRKEMLKLNEDSFIEWLDQFDHSDLMGALEGVMLTYNGQLITTSEAKKNNEEPTEA
jgi:hypothetical protein